MKQYKITLLKGDGIGPEIVNEAIKVLDKIAEKYGNTFTYDDVDMGGVAIDKWGDPLPQAMLDKCLAADSVLLGAVGGPKWEGLPGEQRPEKGLLRLRAPAGREDDALVVDRIADVGVAEQFVECGADVLVRDRKGDVPVERNILGVVEEGVAALLLDLLHHRRNGGVRSLERDVFYLSLYGDGGDCERHAQRQCIRPDRAADSGCRGTV